MAEPAARVLIVDDNKVNRLLLSRSVEMQGHRAALAENGRVALEMLRREPFEAMGQSHTGFERRRPGADGWRGLRYNQASVR